MACWRPEYEVSSPEHYGSRAVYIQPTRGLERDNTMKSTPRKPTKLAQEPKYYGRDEQLPAVFEGSTGEIVRQMREGTSARAVPAVAANLGVSQERLFELLRLPKSTVKGRISKDEALSAIEQDRLYRAEQVLKRAIEVLEDHRSARAWLAQANRSLGWEVPLALLDTEAGYELVLDTLGRIEYGVIS